MHIWVGALLLVAGCGRSGVPAAVDEGGGGPSIALPHGAPPAEIPESVDVGRGLDGSIVFTSNLTELDDCVGIESGDGIVVELSGDHAAIVAGRRLLLMQMNDAIGDSGPTQPIANPGRAGQWEIVEVQDIAGRNVTLVAPLVNAAYETDLLNGFRAQACVVREYTDVTVTSGATVQPREWDGTRGGVLAWMVSGTLDVQSGASLSAAASGFRGGICGIPGSASNVTSYDVPNGSGGGKGEGLDSRWFLLFGRGAVANAGGGGNGLNAGGGGGGGAGEGGGGGRQRDDQGGITVEIGGGNEDSTRGLAGGSLVDTTRMIFGGGGGAGHLDGAQLSRCGGAGGGILHVRTAVLAGAGEISADGEDGASANLDGGGGGGAGGTIEILALDSAAFTGALTADGGEGGDVINTSFDIQYGPGGGGGGGSVRATGVTGTALVRAAGGDAGKNMATMSSWDADEGQPGAVLSNP